MFYDRVGASQFFFAPKVIGFQGKRVRIMPDILDDD
jgi:hypothetical protein